MINRTSDKIVDLQISKEERAFVYRQACLYITDFNEVGKL